MGVVCTFQKTLALLVLESDHGPSQCSCAMHGICPRAFKYAAFALVLPSEKGLPAWLQEMAKHMLAHIAKDGSEALPPIAVSTFSKSGKVYGSGDRAWETTWRVCVHDA